MKFSYIKTAPLKKLALESHKKRLSTEFLKALDDMVKQKIDEACSIHNGGRKTVDITIAAYTGITRPPHSMSGGNN